MDRQQLLTLRNRIAALPTSQRLILSGELMAAGFPDLAMAIAEHVIVEWQAIKALAESGDTTIVH